MPYKLFKKFLTDQLQSKDEKYNFEGSFSEALNRETSHEEAVCLLLALVPHVLPGFLDEVIHEVFPDGGDLFYLGGMRSANHRGLIPTGETLQYFLAGNDINNRLEITELFNRKHWFFQDDILYLEPLSDGEPLMSGKIILSRKAISLLIYGKESEEEALDFPAKKITTELDWSNLILTEKTKDQIDEVIAWEKNKNMILNDWQQSKFFKKGYRVLFYGPSGTGKTLTASLLGKEISLIRNKDVPVYRIDLSMLISKYIGETEKNLEKLFVKAENKDWILFFDEGENLFSSRTSVKDSHDKYANQEVSYLLQRIEDFNGLIIVATNLKMNMDHSFARRFQAMIEFKNPTEKEREELWSNILPNENLLAREENLLPSLTNYNLTGGNIVNVVQYACLKASEMPQPMLTSKNCLAGIKLELAKMGKTL